MYHRPDWEHKVYLAACLFVSAATIAVELAPDVFGRLCCPDLRNMVQQLPSTMAAGWSNPDEMEGSLDSMGELAFRLHSISFESTAFHFIYGDLNPANAGSIWATATWKEWLSDKVHPALALKALCLVMTYLTLNPLNILCLFARPRSLHDDEAGMALAHLICIGFLAAILVPAALNFCLDLVHPYKPVPARVLLNCLHLIAWIAVWVICWIYGWVTMGVRIFAVPVILVITSPILLLHAWLLSWG